MRGNTLKEWLFNKRLDDAWWVAVGDEVQPEKLALSQIELLASLHRGKPVRLLHASMAAMQSPPWVDYESEVTPQELLESGVRTLPVPLRLPPGRGMTRSPIPLKRTQVPFARGNTRPPFPVRSVQPEYSQQAAYAEPAYVVYEPQREASHKYSVRRAVAITSLALVAFLSAAWVVGRGQMEREMKPYDPTASEAYSAAHPLVREFLNKPGSVSFLPPSSSDVVVTPLDSGRFRLSSWATLKRPDGKTMAIPFRAEVRYAADSGRWELTYIRADGRESGVRPTDFDHVVHVTQR